MSVDPDSLRVQVIQGWQHLNLSYDSVIGALNYQATGEPGWLPTVLSERRAALLATAEAPESVYAGEQPPEPDWDCEPGAGELPDLVTPVLVQTVAGRVTPKPRPRDRRPR